MRLLLALAAVLLLPAAAEAAGPKITWPEQRSYAPGETIRVKVASSVRVNVSFVRESASGKVLKVVARRTLRRGTFSASRAARGPLLAAGRHPCADDHRRSPSRTRQARSRRTRTRSCPSARGRPAIGPSCGSARRASPPAAALPLRDRQHQHGLPHVGVGYSFERLLHDGTWVPVPSTQLFIRSPLLLLGPGGTYAKQAR